MGSVHLMHMIIMMIISIIMHMKLHCLCLYLHLHCFCQRILPPLMAICMINLNLLSSLLHKSKQYSMLLFNHQ
ncbi:hypothetical protein F5879DRAFT_976915 [Lentinula edodes]|nr:hypothetical protein F5879DRAFT_976915 [Lentinula edodes]